jgi:hypothetical protein
MASKHGFSKPNLIVLLVLEMEVVDGARDGEGDDLLYPAIFFIFPGVTVFVTDS